jgi:HMG (high mobility group) box
MSHYTSVCYNAVADRNQIARMSVENPPVINAYGFDIDWNVECIEENDGTVDGKCDIQEMLESIDFIDCFCSDFEYNDAESCDKELRGLTSVGQPTCEKKDKASSNLYVKDFSGDIAHQNVCIKQRPTKKRKTSVIKSFERTRKKKQKGLPKRPLSAYNLFFQSERPKIFEEGVINHKRISFEGLAKLVGQRWQVLDEDMKQELRRRSQDDILRYRKEIEEYREKHCEDTVKIFPLTKTLPGSPKILNVRKSPKRKRRHSGGSSVEGGLSQPLPIGNAESIAYRDKDSLEISFNREMATLERSTNRETHPNEGLLIDGDKLSSPYGTKYLGKRRTSLGATEPILLVSSCSQPLPSPPPLLDFIPARPLSVIAYSTIINTSDYHRDIEPPGISPVFDTGTKETDACCYFPSRFLHPAQFPLRLSQYPQSPCINDLPIGKEVKMYDPDLGIERLYKLEYKCFAMKRSEARSYMANFSTASIHGTSYVSLEQLSHAPHPPGVEVKMPKSH